MVQHSEPLLPTQNPVHSPTQLTPLCSLPMQNPVCRPTRLQQLRPTLTHLYIVDYKAWFNTRSSSSRHRTQCILRRNSPSCAQSECRTQCVDPIQLQQLRPTPLRGFHPKVLQEFITILTLSATPPAWPINLGHVILNTYPTSTTPSLILGSPFGESARRTGAASGLQVMFPHYSFILVEKCDD